MANIRMPRCDNRLVAWLQQFAELQEKKKAGASMIGTPAFLSCMLGLSIV